MVSERKKRNIYNETLRRAQSGDDSSYVRGQLRSMGLNMRTAQDAPRRASVTPQWQKNLGKEVRKLGSTTGTMSKDLGTLAYSPFKPMMALGADLFSQGLGSLSQAEKARVGGKFNAPLNVKKGTSAYNWLLDDVIEDEYKNDFRREVKNNNLYWTELNKFADDEYIGGGQLARGINTRNEGIAGTDRGTDAYEDLVGQGKALRGTGMIGNAADRVARAQEEGRAGFATPEMRQAAVFGAELPIKPEGPLDKIIGWNTDISDAQDLVGTLGTGAEDPTVFRPRQEGLDWDISPEEQELLISVEGDDFYKDSWGVTKEQYDKIMNPFPLTREQVDKGLWSQAEGYDDKWLEDALGYPVYKSKSGRFFKVNPETGYVQMDEDITDEVTKLSMSMRTDSPVSTGTTSPLYGIYPNYTPNPIFDELEDMDELELLDWGILNPNEAEVFGFNPNYVTDSWID